MIMQSIKTHIVTVLVIIAIMALIIGSLSILPFIMITAIVGGVALFCYVVYVFVYNIVEDALRRSRK